jgi:hypothetical protein
LKTVEYRGGVISFRIPNNWIEEYETDGGGTFYEDVEDSGTLRLNILTFEAPEVKLPASGYAKILEDKKEPEQEITKLSSGDGLKKYVNRTNDGEEDISVFYFEVVHIAPPKKIYLAIFSWTILTSQEFDPAFVREKQMLESELKNTVFHSSLGNM